MENFINPGDIAFGISSSGNSPNVINALLFAKEKGAKTIAMVGFDGGQALKIADMVGFDGGQALKIADMALFVPSEKGKYGIVKRIHEVIHHLLYEFAVLLEK